MSWALWRLVLQLDVLSCTHPFSVELEILIVSREGIRFRFRAREQTGGPGDGERLRACMPGVAVLSLPREETRTIRFFLCACIRD